MIGLTAYQLFYAIKFHFMGHYSIPRDGYLYTKFTANRLNDLAPALQNKLRLLEQNHSVVELRNRFISVFVAKGEGAGIMQMSGAEADSIFADWQKRVFSMEETFRNDIKYLISDAQERRWPRQMKEYKSVDGILAMRNSHPEIIRLALGSHISIETLMILWKIDKHINQILVAEAIDPIYQTLHKKLLQYSSLVNIMGDKYRGILISEFNSGVEIGLDVTE